MKTTPKTPFILAILFTLVPLLSPAANLTWDANPGLTGAQDGSGTWDTNAANWWTGAANAAWNSATPDVAFLGNANGTAGTVTLGTNIVSANITFNAPSVGNYVLAGGGFTLGLTNRTVIANVNSTISANIVGGSVTTGNSAAQTPIGTLTLSGNNTYTGGFVLGANAPNTTTSARISSSTALGAGTLSFNGNGNATSPRLELTGGVTVTNAVSMAGRNNVAQGFESFSGANTLSGNITFAAGGSQYPFQVDGSSTLTLGGLVTIQATGPRGVILRGTGNGTVSSNIVGGAASVATIVLNKAGSGTWTFAGANTFIGTHIVSGGTLTLDYTTQNNAKLSPAMPLHLAGGTLNLNNGSFTEVSSSNMLVAGSSAITRSAGTSTLRLNAINRRGGSTLNLGVASIADTDTLNANGILGGFATVGGADWAINSTGAGDGPITVYTGYTDIAATGSTIADGAASNVRLNSAGGGGNIALGAATTTVNTLHQNTTTAATVNTTGGTLRLGATGGVLVPPTAQSLTIGTAADAGTLTAGGADNTAGEVILINNSANGLTVNSTITDNGSGVVALTKSGSGSATLVGNNTHTGTNYVSGGTLNISSAANLGTGPVLINGGTLNATASADLGARVTHVGPVSGYGHGTISVASGQELTLPGVVANATPTTAGISVAGGLTKTGAGTLVLAGANTYLNGTVINGGAVSITADNNLGGFDGPSQNGAFTVYRPENIVLNSGTLLASNIFTLSANRGIRLGPINGSGSGTLAVADGMTLTFNGQISDNWNGTGSLIKSDTGTLVLGGGVNDYTGDTTISAGTLQLNNSRAIPNGAGKGNLINNSALTVNGVNVQLNGLTGSGTVDNITGTAMTLTVGNNNQGGTLNGAIGNSGGGPLALAKTGSATLTLGGVSSYTGSTLVNSGTLALSGSAAIGSSTNIAVASGATFNVSGLTGGTLTLASGQTLSGLGNVLGTIDNGSGASVAPGASAGTITIGALTLSGGSLNYELANVTTTGAGVNDHTVVTGLLNISGATTLNLTYLNGLPAGSGKYTLISYSSFAGDVNNITPVPGFTITNNTAFKTIELIVNHVPVSLTWRGDGSGNVWDINTTPNWNANTVTFFNGDTANFDNSGSNTPAIFISTPVIAAAVNVNASQNYNFTGSSIGSASLTKGGSGTLTLENDTFFADGGIISGGTLQIGNAGTSGSIAGGNLTNNSAIVVNRVDDAIITNAISGSGSVTQTGTGTLALNGSNSYAGLTLVSVGRLYPRNGAALGDIPSGTIVSADAQIYMDQNVNFPAEPLTLNGTGLNGAGDGALRKGGGGVTTFGGPVTLGSDVVIALDGNATLNLTNAAGISGTANLTLTGGAGSQGLVSGPINLGAGAGILTKAGSGTWTLAEANSMSLATITEGTLALANNSALGTNLNVVMTSIAGGPGLSGTRLTLSGGVSFGATRTLAMPSGGAGAIRSAFFGTGAGLTNSWAGPVTLFGDSDPGNFLAFGADNNSTFMVSGNVTADSSFAGRFFLRGNGSGGGSTGLGIIGGIITLNATTGAVQVEDGATWILATAGHTWTTTFFANSSRLILGANNAIPVTSTITINSGANNRIDLNGFAQTVTGLEMGPGLNITNSSSSADSTLTYVAAGLTTYGGTISDGTRKLNLVISTGNLGLTNPASLNLTKSTVSIASGASLELNFIGTNTVNALVTNGVSVPAGTYNVLNAAPYIGGVGNVRVVPGPSGPATLTNSVSGTTLSLSWPAGQGWRLQAQTNSLSTGISGNWAYVTDGSVNSTNITVNPANPTVFYRLTYP